MLGSIIGDLVGSVYEYGQVNNVSPIKIKKLIKKNAFISDDSILTIAIADAIIHKKDYGKTLREYVSKYKTMLPNIKPYFKTIFSPNFERWANGNSEGNSMGNGAMMRISPVGYLFNNETDVIKHALLATKPSHNSSEAIECARIIALIIFYARQGLTKEKIIDKLKLNIKKPKILTFNYTCGDTIDLCLYSLFTANNFEESIKLALSFGGDTDTNACIVGGMAEALYGIPVELKEQALKRLPEEFKIIINKAYSLVK